MRQYYMQAHMPTLVVLQVHCEWLNAICRGISPPQVVPVLLPEEADLYLQDSYHARLPPPWRLISVSVMGQSNQKDSDRCAQCL